MDFLKELYLGKIFPADSTAYQNPAYREASQTYTLHYHTLKQNLDSNMIAELKKMTDAHDLLLTIQDEEAFKLGFRLGVQTMCACWNAEPSANEP